MPKTKTFRVVNGRFQFKCPECQARRMVAVAGGVRRRSFKCHKCSEIVRGILNRRVILREQQLGKAILQTSESQEVEVDLFDISPHGVGFDVSIRDVRKLAVGKTVTLRCTWNPRLLHSGRYVIRSIKGQRVGVEQEGVSR